MEATAATAVQARWRGMKQRQELFGSDDDGADGEGVFGLGVFSVEATKVAELTEILTRVISEVVKN